MLPKSRNYLLWFMAASFPLYFVLFLVSSLLILEEAYYAYGFNVFLNVILPILMIITIITGIILHLIHHIINLRDIQKLNYATHRIEYNLNYKLIFFVPYFSIIWKQKLLKDHLENFHEDEELPKSPTLLLLYLVIFLGIGIFMLIDLMTGMFTLDYYLGDYWGILFFLLTLFLNPVPLRYYEFKWQDMMNLHIKNHLDALD